MSLFSGLYVGVSGLQAGQNSLNTTAHNLANVDTEGYVRQQAYQATSDYTTISIDYNTVGWQQYGTGVTFAATRQVRDYFLDVSYRTESGRSAFYETSYNVLAEVEVVLGELNEVAFQDALDDLYTAIQELSKEPDGAVTQALLVQTCSSFLERAQSVYSSLSSYQDNLNASVISTTETINAYGNQISLLNQQIRYIESAGVENANDLRDARNQLLDELSAMVDIDVTETSTGAVTIKIEGEPFVTETNVYEMELYYDTVTGFATPFWPQNASYSFDAYGNKIYDISESGAVFDLTKTISSALDTDIGSLKATLLARGDHRANYTDMLDADTYNTEVAESVLMNVQAEFDQLIHAVVTMINDTLTDAGYPEMFQLVSGYTGDEDAEDTTTLFTTANIIMNEELVQEPTLLGFVKEDGSVDFETLEQLKEAFDNAAYTLNPNVLTQTNIMDYYSALVSQVGNSGYVYKSIMEYQQQTVETVESARQSILGVSSDEELSNMVRFQNAYNAASRYITTIDEMIEHIINTLGA